jgi:hypothetical protein
MIYCICREDPPDLNAVNGFIPSGVGPLAFAGHARLLRSSAQETPDTREQEAHRVQP